MTRREFFDGIKTWKGAELRGAVAANRKPVDYRDFTQSVMLEAKTMFVKSALMAARHKKPA